MTAQFTPGPWYSNGPSNIYGADLLPTEYRANGEPIPPLPRCIAHIVQGNGISLDEKEANAALIAAAPGLLEALQVFVDRYVSLVQSGDAGFWDPETDEEVIQARAAIAKATEVKP